MDPTKVSAILDASMPASKTEICSFLGLVGHYRCFSKYLAQLLSCVHTFTSFTTQFQKTNDMNKAFESLKMGITSAPILSFSDFDKHFVIVTDAYTLAAGAILSQNQQTTRSNPSVLPDES